MDGETENAAKHKQDCAESDDVNIEDDDDSNQSHLHLDLPLSERLKRSLCSDDSPCSKAISITLKMTDDAALPFTDSPKADTKINPEEEEEDRDNRLLFAPDEIIADLPKDESKCMKGAHSSNMEQVNSSTSSSMPKSPIEDISIFTCYHCESQFKRKYDLSQHIRKHFNDSQHRKILKRKKNNNEKHVCETCGKVFRLKGQLFIHNISHKISRKHKCNECDKQFKLKGQLFIHKIKHSNERPHRCFRCRKKFKLKGQLFIHMMNRHSNDRPYKCVQCKLKFHLKGQLFMHRIGHSMNEDDDEV